MVGGQEDHTACVQHGVGDFADALVNSLNGLDSGIKHAGVADHIAVGEVQDDDIILAALDAGLALVGDLIGAHLGLQVVGGNLRAGDDLAVLALAGLLDAAVEEEGHMGVFLGLGNAQLGLAVGGQVLAQGVLQLNGGIRNLAVGHRGVVLGHADIVDLLAAAAALKAGEGVIAEDAGHLAGTVGAEVHEDDGVAIFNAAALAGDNGDDELVGHVGGVAGLNGLLRVGSVVALAVDKGGVGFFLTIPVVVAVHGVVTAGDTGDLADAQLVQLGLQVSQEALAAVRVGVTAVHDAVQVNILRAHVLSHFQHAIPVIGVAVDAAGADQSHQMDGLARVDSGLHVLDQHRVFQHLAVLDGLGDEGQLLVNDAACAHVGVADFRVAHLAVGQADSHAGCLDGGHGVVGEQLIQVGLVGGGHGIAEGLVGRPAEAVHNAEHNRFFGHKIETP